MLATPRKSTRFGFHSLPACYRILLNLRRGFDLVVVGKDPFPTAPTGIPFCKPSWAEQQKRNGCGIYVLEALGVDIPGAMALHPTPAGLFFSLAVQGVAFLNCSYHFLGSSHIAKRHLAYVRHAFAVNKPIVEKANVVLLCGAAQVLGDLYPRTARWTPVIHPDPRNRMRAAWENWWSPSRLKQEYDLYVSA